MSVRDLTGSREALFELFSAGYPMQDQRRVDRKARRAALAETWSRAIMANVDHPAATAKKKAVADAAAKGKEPPTKKAVAKARSRRLRFLRANVGRIQAAWVPRRKPTKAKTGMRGKALQAARHEHRAAEMLRLARVTKDVMARAKRTVSA